MAANSKFAVATHILTSIAYMSSCGKPELLSAKGLVLGDKVAESVNTNPVVVRRLCAKLIEAGLVVSHPGKGGGLELARRPESITLCDVYSAVGDLDVFAFNPNEPFAKCVVSSNMGTLLGPVFADVSEAVNERLQTVTIADLVKRVMPSSAPALMGEPEKSPPAPNNGGAGEEPSSGDPW